MVAEQVEPGFLKGLEALLALWEGPQHSVHGLERSPSGGVGMDPETGESSGCPPCHLLTQLVGAPSCPAAPMLDLAIKSDPGPPGVAARAWGLPFCLYIRGPRFPGAWEVLIDASCAGGMSRALLSLRSVPVSVRSFCSLAFAH